MQGVILYRSVVLIVALKEEWAFSIGKTKTPHLKSSTRNVVVLQSVAVYTACQGGETVLTCASMYGDASVIEKLLVAGADVAARPYVRLSLLTIHILGTFF